MRKKLLIILSIVLLILIVVTVLYITTTKKDVDTQIFISWDETKKVNTPTILEGMTPIVYDENGNIVKLDNNQIENENWYEYIIQETDTEKGGTSKWANVVTADGSMWVWIPRFAYKITYVNETDKSEGGTIDIKFLKGITNLDENDVNVTELGYIVHPAFQNGKKTNYANGEWNKEIPGFWVAKFEAGFTNQQNTASEKIQSVESNVVYTDGEENVFGEIIKNETKMTYPVFIGKTYTYNNIIISDMYNLSKQLTALNNPYGLQETQTDSHMMKNSEWGAVVYLAHSKYGRNGTRITINNVYLDEKIPSIGTVTGYGSEDENSIQNNIENVENGLQDNINDLSFAWNTKKGQLASTTGNFYGIYDLNGGSSEYTSGYLESMTDSVRERFGQAFSTDNKSTEYYTVYSDKNISDTPDLCYNENSNIYGDATIETSSKGIGYNSWNKETSTYISSVAPFFLRSGAYNRNGLSGVFSFNNHSGHESMEYTFRVILVEK